MQQYMKKKINKSDIIEITEIQRKTLFEEFGHNLWRRAYLNTYPILNDESIKVQFNYMKETKTQNVFFFYFCIRNENVKKKRV